MAKSLIFSVKLLVACLVVVCCGKAGDTVVETDVVSIRIHAATDAKFAPTASDIQRLGCGDTGIRLSIIERDVAKKSARTLSLVFSRLPEAGSAFVFSESDSDNQGKLGNVFLRLNLKTVDGSNLDSDRTVEIRRAEFRIVSIDTVAKTMDIEATVNFSSGNTFSADLKVKTWTDAPACEVVENS